MRKQKAVKPTSQITSEIPFIHLIKSVEPRVAFLWLMNVFSGNTGGKLNDLTESSADKKL